ncbi:unnamed protein product [Symbiodinium sp. CCMP2592]|nr:unnamed protein product [Symbiodinium sp. CCMP2592]
MPWIMILRAFTYLPAAGASFVHLAAQVPWQSLPGLDAGLEHAARAEYELGVQANFRKFLGRCNLKQDALRAQLRMPLAAALPSLACMQCRPSMLRRSSFVFAGFVSASLQVHHGLQTPMSLKGCD